MAQRRYFGTDGIRGPVGGELIQPEFVLRLGHAAGRVLCQGGGTGHRPTVLIGKDTRISGYMLESALEAGLSAAGVDVLLAGPMPTPAVAYLTRALRLSAGIVISASHNPYQDNGIKFFSGSGRKLPDEIESQIEQAIDQPVQCVASSHLGRAKRLADAPGRYIEFCKSTFPQDLDLRGLKIVVDSAHGAAYHVAAAVFRELGADVVAVGDHPDGFNINEGVGALHVEHLIQSVRDAKADFGIALDGDADRLQMVDGEGRAFDGDELLYVITRGRLAAGPVAGVVGTLMTNMGLERALATHGVAFERAKVGDRYVMELLEQTGWLLGGESSGHLICLDRHTTGDGIVAALQVLATARRLDQSLSELCRDFVRLPQVMINVALPPGLDWSVHTGLKQQAEQVRAELGQAGRVLIRPSGTEPKLRIMVEATSESVAREAAQSLANSLQT